MLESACKDLHDLLYPTGKLHSVGVGTACLHVYLTSKSGLKEEIAKLAKHGFNGFPVIVEVVGKVRPATNS